jgi:hypothetical protein
MYETPESVKGALEGFYDPWRSGGSRSTSSLKSVRTRSSPAKTGYLRGREDIEVTARTNWVWTFRDGAVTEFTSYPEWEEALEAARLSE